MTATAPIRRRVLAAAALPGDRVVCSDSDVAACYAEPIPTELAGYVFRAAVLGPGEIPAITDPREAAARPELAAMAVMAHGRDRAVAEAFVAGLELIKPEYAPEYYEYAYAMAAPTVRRILEEIMSSATWPVYSPFAREHYGRGKNDGRVEGRVEGEAQAVLKVLAARRIEVPDEARARIRACTDLQQLDAWLERATVVTTIAALFE